MSDDSKSGDLPTIAAFDLWSKYEDVAMHFNDLLMKWRLQAIGGLAALVTLTGAVIKEIPVAEVRYSGMLLLTGTLLCDWTAIACLDLFYYRQLLRGAVEELLRVEQPSNIKLSTTIEKYAKTGAIRAPWIFYVLGAVPLVAILVYAGVRLAHPPQLVANPSVAGQAITNGVTDHAAQQGVAPDGAAPRH